MAITYHANVERKARFEYIEATVGFGTKEIASYTFKSPDSRKPSKSVLTETGVIKDVHRLQSAWTEEITAPGRLLFLISVLISGVRIDILFDSLHITDDPMDQAMDQAACCYREQNPACHWLNSGGNTNQNISDD